MTAEGLNGPTPEATLAASAALTRGVRFGVSTGVADTTAEERLNLPCRRLRGSVVRTYGSVARGEDEPGSDFDLALFIPGARLERVLAAVRKQLRPIEDEFGVTCSVVGLAPADIARHASGGASAEGWWGSMLGDAKVLKGPHPEELAADPGRTAAA